MILEHFHETRGIIEKLSRFACWPSIFGACGGRVIALATSAAILVALLLKPLNATRTTG
jgi:hypothetical protein